MTIKTFKQTAPMEHIKQLAKSKTFAGQKQRKQYETHHRPEKSPHGGLQE